LNSARQ